MTSGPACAPSFATYGIITLMGHVLLDGRGVL